MQFLKLFTKNWKVYRFFTIFMVFNYLPPHVSPSTKRNTLYTKLGFSKKIIQG